MKAIVDADTCIGCGLCADTCPAVYKMEGDKAITIVDTVPADQEDCAKRGGRGMPGGGNKDIVKRSPAL